MTTSARAGWTAVGPREAGVSWWLYLLLVIDLQRRDQPDQRADGVELKLWLLRQASARGVFTLAESAQKTAYFVAGMRRFGAELAKLLPSADDVVQACLEAIPVDLDHAAILDGRRHLHGLDRRQMRHSLQAKNLVNAASWQLDEIQDERLADRPREWIAAKLRLV